MTIKIASVLLLLLLVLATTNALVGRTGKCYLTGIPSVFMLMKKEFGGIDMIHAYVHVTENTTEMTSFDCKIVSDSDDRTFVVAEQDFKPKVINKWHFCVYNWFNCLETTTADKNDLDDVAIEMTVLLRQSVAIGCFTLYCMYATAILVGILRSKPVPKPAPQPAPESDDENDDEQPKVPPTTPIDNENHDINLIQRVKQDDSIKVVQSNEEV